MAIGRPLNLTPNVATKNISVVATADQTSFTVAGGYIINEIGVYRNGTRLVDGRDFTATDGAIVTLLSAATVGDVLEFAVFDAFNIADAVNTSGDSTINGNLTATTFIGDVTGDASGTAGGLTGSPNITINNLVGVAATFSGAADFNGAIDVDGHTELDDVNVSGAITATTFTGNLTGNASGSSGSCTGNAGGLTGSPDITINNLVGVAATFSGVVTYEDVTNVDSLGIITARSGIEFGASGVGGTITAVGNAEFAGITTAGGGFRATTGGVEVTAGGLTITAGESYFGGGLSEKATIVANKLSAAANIDVSTGNVWYFSTNETTTGTPNLRWDGSTTLASKLATGDNISVSIISKPNGAGYYAQMTIDGVAQTEEWNGGSAPAAANAGGYDITTYQILKTGSGTTDYIVLANVSNFA